MEKNIPFMTDDEIMKFLSQNMHIHFDDYEEVKANYEDALEKLKKELGEEKHEIAENLISAYKAQVASDMIFSYFNGYKHNLSHFKNPVERTFLEVDATYYTNENIMLQMPKRSEAQSIISSIHKQLEHLDYDTYFMPFDDFYNCYLVIAPKYAHYIGYLDANELLPLMEVGYCEDRILTTLYHRHIKELIGINAVDFMLSEQETKTA